LLNYRGAVEGHRNGGGWGRDGSEVVSGNATHQGRGGWWVRRNSGGGRRLELEKAEACNGGGGEVDPNKLFLEQHAHIHHGHIHAK
jgi:hypothetical protein